MNGEKEGRNTRGIGRNREQEGVGVSGGIESRREHYRVGRIDILVEYEDDDKKQERVEESVRVGSRRK